MNQDRPNPPPGAQRASAGASTSNLHNSPSPYASQNSSHAQFPPHSEQSDSLLSDKPNGKPVKSVGFAEPEDIHREGDEDDDDDSDFENWEEADGDPYDMPSDLRPPFHRPTDGRSQQPLLGSKRENGYDSGSRPETLRRRSTFRERDPDADKKSATRRRYIYAGFFLIVSLICFTVQTETAHYITSVLGWRKSYAMLYFTHGSWSILWFIQLGILRIQKWNMPWDTFWRRHVQILRQTAQMVQHQDINAPSKHPHQSPWASLARTTAFVTCSLTVAGGAWYVAVSMTTSSDLTAIYNCSAFFAYVFSVPLLKERLRWSKVLAVLVAIAGVLIVAYGDTNPRKSGSKSGGHTGPSNGDEEESSEDKNRALGNLVIGIGSILYGFYEVLYKKYACPPEDTSPGRSMIFANFFGSLIGLFTLFILWIPLPFLNLFGWEIFELPRGEAAWMLAISTVCNALFSGSFLVLISLTSPVLSSVAALLTIFIVALVDQLLPGRMHVDLTGAAIFGGVLIIVAFLVLSYATYREMDEDSKKKGEDQVIDESDEDV